MFGKSDKWEIFFYLLKFTEQFYCIFIIKVFRTIVFIFIVISTTFRPICPPAFFRCLSNSGTFTELRTTSFIETTGVTSSDSVCHDRVQVLSIPVYYSPVVKIEPATFEVPWRSRVRQTPEEGRRTYRPKRCGNNNKDENNSPKNLNDKNQQASSQKFRQLILLYNFCCHLPACY